MRPETWLALALLGISSHAGIAQDADRLTSGPGSTLTENKCKICHELQHIRRTPLSRGEWSDNLKNMRERGTPMTEAELAVILDYLSAYYSRDPPPPPAPDTLGAASGDPVARLLEANACSGCHTLDKRVVGPSFREIAQRYAGDATAAARLAAKVRSGGQGAWGQIPMPPAPDIAEPDLATLVQWLLGQK
ncbi:MAG: c-type cytochrome [Candidatus Parcubacteria bacterium]|nr:c-type cytochrome [Burkholderiales bacterium]